LENIYSNSFKGLTVKSLNVRLENIYFPIAYARLLWSRQNQLPDTNNQIPDTNNQIQIPTSNSGAGTGSGYAIAGWYLVGTEIKTTG
jgi:hypothetical protein